MRCLACLKEGTKKDFLYDENKNLYCINPFTCNENHPNSVKNIIKRGAAVKMFTEDELEFVFFDINHVSEEMKERVLKVATKPQSIRLSKYDIAYYLLQLQDVRGLSSISEAVRYCVMYTKKYMPIDGADENLEISMDESNEFEEEISTGIKFVVPDIPVVPSSVNVDWSKVKAEPVQQTVNADDEEDEF